MSNYVRSPEPADRISAANAVGSLAPDSGVALLLALTVDLDVGEEERLEITRSLAGSSPQAAAAIRWLTFTAYWDSPDMRYRVEAISQVTRLSLDEEAERAGFEAIIGNPHLDDHYRAAAYAELAGKDGAPAPLLQRSLIPATILITELSELAEYGHTAAFAALCQLAADSDIAADDRIDIAGIVSEFDKDTGIALLTTLSQDPALSEEQQSSVAAEAAALIASL